MSDMYVYMYVCMYVCMHVCTKSFLKTTTNSSCVCTHLANKADSDSDSDSDFCGSSWHIFKTQNQILTSSFRKLLELTGNLNSKLPMLILKKG